MFKVEDSPAPRPEMKPDEDYFSAAVAYARIILKGSLLRENQPERYAAAALTLAELVLRFAEEVETHGVRGAHLPDSWDFELNYMLLDR